MAEASLYRRHRPQSFDEVVGQEHVVRTLRNAIERDRVHHAYLFVGSRGTGKTSMAKILARSLNCVNGPTLTPCGECESCRSIAAGTSMDVVEMDAASNRSVDDIRELRDRVGFVSAKDLWKVYILDEAHMLTREAWNAFLKTLEEPPPKTVFVLATTEPHKVMPTIIDRCQRFDFGRPSPDEIAEVVRRVSSVEGFTIADGAIAAIARAANGSFRDALGTLDQLVAYSGNEVATEDVLTVLGVADAELLFRTTEAIAAGDGKAVLEAAAELSRSGRDPGRFAADLVAHLRQLLVVGTLGEVPDHFFVADEQAGRISEQASRLGEVALVRAIDQLSAAITAIREGDEARMTLELALLRVARPQIDPSRAALAQRLERLERSLEGGVVSAGRGVAPSPPAPASGAPPPPEPAAEPDPGSGHHGPEAAVAALAHGAVATAEQVRHRVEEVTGGVAARVEEAVDEVAAAVGEVRTGVAARVGEVRTEVAARVEGVTADASARAEEVAHALDLERVADFWPAVVEQLQHSGSEFLSAAFQVARPVSLDPDSDVLEVGFPPSAAFNKRKAETKENRERFADALRTIVGRQLRPVYVTLEDEEAEAGGPEAEPAEVDEREFVEHLMAEFDAEELLEDPDEPQEEAS